jgi:outer membrane protein OmpA-like peptidoglycan-associated protein
MIRATGICLLVGLAAPAAFAQETSTPMKAGTAGTTGTSGMTADPSVYQVFFALNSDRLDSDALAAVTSAANDFRRTGNANVRLSGHTDTTGSAEYNERLAQRRADAVARELERLGVPESSITRDAEGESNLLVETGQGVAERRNRRVQISMEEPAAAPVAEAPAAVPAAVTGAAATVADVIDRGRFSVGAYYGLNLLDEGHDNGDDDGTSNLGGLNLSFDYLMTDWLNLSLEQAVFYNWGTDDEGMGGRSAAGVDFVFPTGDKSTFGTFSSILPYVGANIGYIYGEGIDDDWFAGPEIGLNIGPFNAKIAYDIPWGRSSMGDGIISTTIGIGITF